MLLRGRAEIDLHAVQADLLGNVQGRRIAAFSQRPVAGPDLEPRLAGAASRGAKAEQPKRESGRFGRMAKHGAASQRAGKTGMAKPRQGVGKERIEIERPTA